ncbi:MAG: SHOCT domain-containing protein [Desulfuromonadales bacterium]
MHHFFWYNNGLCGPGSSFHGPWGFVINLVFWCLVLAALVWFFRTVTRTPDVSWEEALKMRYVSGEINREEFKQIKESLQ